MHILYIHQHFAVPEGSTGTRSYEFARRWVGAGHAVTVICGKYDRGGLDLSRKRQSIDGIDVWIVGMRYSNKQRFLTRVVSFLYFIVAAISAGCRVKRFDAIFATSTPLTIGIPAMFLKWLRRRPYVFEVRDQWPEVPIEMGIIRNAILRRCLVIFERRIYRSAAAVVVLSPGMEDGVRKVLGCDFRKTIQVVPNACDIDLFDPATDGDRIRTERKWQDKFIVLHFGAMGRVNSLEFLVRAADRLRGNQSIHFVLVGDGAARPVLEQKADELSVSNIEFVSSRPKAEMPEYVAACDVSTVIIGNYPILEHNSANKFFDSLSAGKPILLNYSGWQRQVIEDAAAGLGCTLYDLDEYTSKVQYLSSQPEKCREMGKNARLLAERDFNRDLLAGRVLRLLEQTCIVQMD